MLKERFDAQVEWVRLGAAPDAGTVRSPRALRCVWYFKIFAILALVVTIADLQLLAEAPVCRK